MGLEHIKFHNLLLGEGSLEKGRNFAKCWPWMGLEHIKFLNLLDGEQEP